MSAPNITDSRFGKAGVYAILAAVAMMAAGPVVIDETAAYLIGALLGVSALGLTVLEAIAAPTTGKVLFLAALALLGGPVFVDALPFELFWGAFPVLVAARYYRMQEVKS